MSEPFNFSETPITQQTRLTARYQTTDPSNRYGGKWFRLTATDGQKYVPTTATEAKTICTTYQMPESYTYPTVSITNEQTGAAAQLTTNNFTKIEFGGGWDEISFKSSDYFFGSNTSTGSRGPWAYISSITGYWEGLNNVPQSSFLAEMSQWGAVDTTGLKLDAYGLTLWSAAIYNARSFSTNTNRGFYGVVEPLVPVSDFVPASSVSSAAECRATMFGVIYFSSYKDGLTGNIAISKGVGFVGDYAEEYLAAFPSVITTTGASSNTTSYYQRRTYIG